MKFRGTNEYIIIVIIIIIIIISISITIIIIDEKTGWQIYWGFIKILDSLRPESLKSLIVALRMRWS